MNEKLIIEMRGWIPAFAGMTLLTQDSTVESMLSIL
jgi:hypothetical protein